MQAAGLLAVAAVPGLVGITGDGLGDPAVLGPGFEDAMRIGAAIVALAGIGAFFLLPDESVDADTCRRTREKLADRPCPVDAAPSATSDSVPA